MTLTDHIEAASGQRLGDSSLFGSGRGRRELATAQRQARFGDPDDPDDPGTSPAPVTLAAAARALRQMPGLEGPDAATARARYGEQRNRALAARQPRSLATGQARRHPDFGESTRQRAERVRQPIQPVPLSGDDYQPVNGSLGGLTAGGW